MNVATAVALEAQKQSLAGQPLGNVARNTVRDSRLKELRARFQKGASHIFTSKGGYLR